jgi:hypothetical protein
VLYSNYRQQGLPRVMLTPESCMLDESVRACHMLMWHAT